MNYGMPYKGSKSKIADEILNVLPDRDVFMDLFGGGGAMAHAAAVSGKYKTVIYNELESVIAKGFEMAINGEFAYDKILKRPDGGFVSREAFLKTKDTDPYAAICFSFGNDIRTYAYGEDVKILKRILHHAVTGKTVKERRTSLRRFMEMTAKMWGGAKQRF